MQARFWRTETESNRDDRAPIEGVRVIAEFGATIPLVRREIRVLIVEEDRWNLFEYWSARAIAEIDGFTSNEAIGRFLGVQTFFIDPAVKALEERGLVTVESDAIRACAGLSEKTGSALEKKMRAIDIVVNHEPVTSRPLAHDLVGSVQQVEFSPTDLPGKLDEAALRRAAIEGINPGEPLEIGGVELISQTWVERPVRIVTYLDDAEGTWNWEVLDPASGRAMPLFRPALESVGFVDACAATFEELERELPDESAVHAPDRWRPMQEMLENNENVEYLDARAARMKAIELIDNAREEVIAFFPWIKAPALVEFEGALQGALDRGVEVVLGYGICEREDLEESHAAAIARLRAMRSRLGAGRLTLKWLGGSHTKEMCVDRREYLHGSHNLLSYRPMPERHPVRRESTQYMREPADFIGALKSLRDFFVERLEQGEASTDSWSARWAARLQLGAEPSRVTEALSEASRAGISVVEVVRPVALGLGFQPSKERVSRCLDLLVAWLPVALERLRKRERGEAVAALREFCVSSSCLHEAHKERLLGPLEAAISSSRCERRVGED